MSRGQGSKFKIYNEYMISCGSEMSDMVFTPGHVLSACTCVEYIFMCEHLLYLPYFFINNFTLLSSSCEYISCHSFYILLEVTLMTSVSDISAKSMCYNDPINRKSLHELRYCWINLLKCAFQNFICFFVCTTVLWRIKQEGRDVMLLSDNIPLKRIWIEVLLTAESLSYFVQ